MNEQVIVPMIKMVLELYNLVMAELIFMGFLLPTSPQSLPMNTGMHPPTHWDSLASPKASFLLLIYDSSCPMSVLAGVNMSSLPLEIFRKLQEVRKDQDMESEK